MVPLRLGCGRHPGEGVEEMKPLRSLLSPKQHGGQEFSRATCVDPAFDPIPPQVRAVFRKTVEQETAIKRDYEAPMRPHVQDCLAKLRLRAEIKPWRVDTLPLRH